MEPAIEKLHARIAVSQTARATLTEHLETDAVVIPNGINYQSFASGPSTDEFGTRVIGFIGRFDEPRKGLSILLESCALLLKSGVDFQLVIAGPGDPEPFIESISPELAERTHFLGRVSEARKHQLLRSFTVYVAPNTGGESFGIILTEAMAAGTPVVATNLPAFVDVLDGGSCGLTFEVGNSEELSSKIRILLQDKKEQTNLRSKGQARALDFDWSVVGESILDIYKLVSASGEKVRLGTEMRFTRIGKSS